MNLDDKIWKTSKSRMNMADRLKSYDMWSQFLIIYYSLCLIAVTIFDMNDKEFDASVPTLILSIIVLVISVFIYAMDYGKRALETQKSYIEMQRKLSKIDRLKDTKKLEEEYYNILDCSENHNNCDYLKVLYSVRHQKENEVHNGKFTWTMYVAYYFCIFRVKILTSILFLIPILMLFFSSTIIELIK